MTGWLEYLWLIGIPLIFIAIVAYVYRPGARQRYRHDAEIPLNEQSDKKHQRKNDEGA
ncbi:MAG: cbb3-type cytochrome c oxidase subunit 3 [Pseudomonadota bacterium]|nr:cbb3-type cytochrome c oxidase subunit 3 [Pseudomonadota bacterium]